MVKSREKPLESMRQNDTDNLDKMYFHWDRQAILLIFNHYRSKYWNLEAIKCSFQYQY